jgi:formate hydrogenlyase subunit 6/NADH:ubiquinone oxidoreductase subunit I
MGLPNGGVTRMAKRSTITPMLKRTFAHLFNKPATTKYPFVKPKLPEDFRGKPVYEIKSCNRIALGQSCPELSLDVHSIMGSACSVCERDCPAFAITIVEVDGKRRPQFDLNKCIFCNQCVESCPRAAIKPSDIYELATIDKNSLVLKPNPNGDEGAK